MSTSVGLYHDSQQRIYTVIYYFLTHSYVKLEDLSEILFISSSTLSITIKKIKEILKDYNIYLKSKPNYGLKATGSEFDFRKCIVMCLKKGYEIDSNLIQIIQESLDSCLAKKGYSISGIYRKSLVLHLYVCICRIRQNYLLEEYHIFSNQDEQNREIARSIIYILESRLNICFPEKECDYIAVQLACKQITKKNKNENMVYNQSILDLVQEMIFRVYEVFGLDFRKDMELQMNLCQHMVPLKQRLRYGFSIENPLLKDIKREYPFAYEIATVASSVIYEQYVRKVQDDEIGFMALSFALSLEKRNDKRKKNILLVCGTGRGSTKLLELKVKQLFEQSIQSIQTCDIGEVKEMDYREIDYIFTTVTIKDYVPVPIVEMPYFINEEKANEIQQQFKLEKKDEFLNYFPEDLFFKDCIGNTKEEIIHFMCDKIVSMGYAMDTLFDYVIERERLGSTSFIEGIAIPHPTISVSEKTFVSVAVLNQAMNWDGHYVRVVFLVSWAFSKTEKLDELYKGIYQLFLNKENIQKLIQVPSFDTLKDIVQ